MYPILMCVTVYKYTYIYLLGSDDSFDCEIAVRMISWMKPLEKSMSQFL